MSAFQFLLYNKDSYNCTCRYPSWAGYPVKDASKYANAASMAKEVIDSSAYFGFALMPDLADLWNHKHEKNNESVFSLYATN